MSQKTFIEKQAKIGSVTVTQDWSMGKYGITVGFNKDNESYSIDTYEFNNRETANSVFNLLVAVTVEMSPEVQEAIIRLIPESEQ